MPVLLLENVPISYTIPILAASFLKLNWSSIEINFERETAITSMGFTAWPSVICSSGKKSKN